MAHNMVHKLPLRATLGSDLTVVQATCATFQANGNRAVRYVNVLVSAEVFVSDLSSLYYVLLMRNNLYDTMNYILNVFPDCGALLPPENGTVSLAIGLLGDNTLNARATYACDHGFTISSAVERTCTETAVWIPDAPTCTISRKDVFMF